jgi:uncharacterized protein
MSSEGRSEIGKITWTDLTVKQTEEVRDFYTGVVGLNSQPHDMGSYDDYDILTPAGGEVVAGICHAVGINADIPPQWLIYITVADVARSAARCVERGGEVVAGPRDMGGHQFCVIRDPAGAVCALYESGDQDE